MFFRRNALESTAHTCTPVSSRPTPELNRQLLNGPQYWKSDRLVMISTTPNNHRQLRAQLI